jgi:primosomal protein N' (replication factor Y)
VCRVQPDVWALPRAFDYLVPSEFAGLVRVGVIVRVPLHGRRVRGWVVADDVVPEAPHERLVPIHGVVSAGAPADVVALATWAAWRWAGPPSVFLRAASPPNLVDAAHWPEAVSARYPVAAPPGEIGARWPDAPVRLVIWPPAADRRALVASLLATDGSTLILVPEPASAGPLVRAVERSGRQVLHHRGDLAERARTEVWDRARRGATVVIGGRAAVWLPIPDLAAVVVLDEHDEAFQDERAPTWHAREVARERARRAKATLTMVSPTPSVDAARARDTVRVVPPARVLRAGWPIVEIVDLRAEPPGTGIASQVLGPAIHRAVDGGGLAICVVNRRGRARLLACRACRTLARCDTCGGALGQPDTELVCHRCGATRPPVCPVCGSTRFRAVRPGVRAVRDEVAALVPRVAVGDVDAATDRVGDAPVLVGTEAVLHRVRRDAHRPVRLVAFLAFDDELLAPRFRAHEQALALLARAARLLGPRGDGGRLLVQTHVPDHPVLEVPVSGDPTAFLAAESAVRAEIGFPPFGALAAISGATPAVDAAAAAIRNAGLSVLGGREGRALVRAMTVEELADGLARADLSAARALGRLRVSVDPPRV